MRAGRTLGAKAALVWPLVLLAAAASAAAQEPAASPGAGEEVLPLDGATARPLAAKGETRVSVPRDAPRLEFDTGTSAYALLRLPDYTQPYTITVQSFCQCMGPDKRIFIPLAAVLDEDFRVTRRLGEHDVARRYPKLSFGDAYPRLEARLGVADDDRADRYLVVYTDGDRVGETFDVAVDFELKRSADAALKVLVSPARR